MAQLVEHDLAKVGVAGSSPVSRSFYNKNDIRWMSFFVINESCRTRSFEFLRSASVRAKPTFTGRRAPSRAMDLTKICHTGDTS